MILFDIHSLPAGIDASIWHQLYSEGLLIYDSTLGPVPFKLDNDNISLIDINNMTGKEINEIINHMQKVNENINSNMEEENKTVSDNNTKLIRYLQSLREGSVAD